MYLQEPPFLVYYTHIKKGGKMMDKDSFIISLEDDGFSEEEAEMIAEDFIKKFGDDPDFQD